MEILRRISRAIDRFNESLGRLIAWLIPAMILVGVWNVIGRYLGKAVGQNLSSNTAIEIQWYLFAIVFLLGAAYTLKHDAHARMDVLYSRWRPRQQKLADLAGTLLFLLPFCIVTLWFTWRPVLNSWRIWENSPNPGGLPVYPIKTVVLVSLGLLIVQGISEAYKKWSSLDNSNSPLEDVDGDR
ncbi:MAG TPA: TRAP transporter small permease subunit [Oscillatoriales cyanobacterium M59_W2019_021]|nr:MAG: TRAP transporter small permease subunit [Cyanobacteria bacterium J055]HIK33384.1 TRAP transporter small permease subunit [Oscillatoriales cyanobacterium M4454_W2019_049]HIK52368.1 TRAP transporter small permease subunit [Oscillatoriales cyanobacterium M59_W2019_021]